jgi:hypothetical protein
VAVCVRTYSGGHELLSTRSKAEKTPDAKNQAEQALQAIDRGKTSFWLRSLAICVVPGARLNGGRTA